MSKLKVTGEVAGRERLLDEAHRLFIERGYAEVSMQEIATAAEMTKAAPYYHFRDKEDLFVHVFIDEMTRMTEAIQVIFERDVPLRKKMIDTLSLMDGPERLGFLRLANDMKKHVSHERWDGVKSQCPNPLQSLEDAFVRAYDNGEFHRISSESAAFAFETLCAGYFDMRRDGGERHGKAMPHSGSDAETLVDIMLLGI